jgi:hypothetical protein
MVLMRLRGIRMQQQQLSRRRMRRRKRVMLSSRTWLHCRRGRAAR